MRFKYVVLCLLLVAVLGAGYWLKRGSADISQTTPGGTQDASTTEGVRVKVHQLSEAAPTGAEDKAVAGAVSGALVGPIGDEKAEPGIVNLPPLPAEAQPHPSDATPPKPSASGTAANGAFKGTPRIALVIDDLGLDFTGTKRAEHLPAAVTLSFMPYASRLKEQTTDARHSGHELLLHMPMEPLGRDDPGPGALLVALPADEIRTRFQTALASFTGFDGVNNHMGSKFTADQAGMEIVIDELQQRKLFFLDSRTSAKTVGQSTAKAHGLPTIARDVFLDDDEAPAAIRNQMEQAERIARKHGSAVVIGHPHAVTLDALAVWLPDAEARGFVFVPLHDLVSGTN